MRTTFLRRSIKEESEHLASEVIVYRKNMATFCSGKTSWPELVGEIGAVAAATIKLQNPIVNPIILMLGTPVTREFRCDRVWVWVDAIGRVSKPPVVG
ncbi:hypothetical protein CUMW_218730 [Citrus unshiu]|uniref:Uncharacterized protein n=2 Tax=Citrus TaxID=2706 RepID=A0A2H5QD50_CITUN|nr:hypothetical protein CUMW_218730 [Citrus unshiu]